MCKDLAKWNQSLPESTIASFAAIVKDVSVAALQELIADAESGQCDYEQWGDMMTLQKAVAEIGFAFPQEERVSTAECAIGKAMNAQQGAARLNLVVSGCTELIRIVDSRATNGSDAQSDSTWLNAIATLDSATTAALQIGVKGDAGANDVFSKFGSGMVDFIWSWAQEPSTRPLFNALVKITDLLEEKLKVYFTKELADMSVYFKLCDAMEVFGRDDASLNASLDDSAAATSRVLQLQSAFKATVGKGGGLSSDEARACFQEATQRASTIIRAAAERAIGNSCTALTTVNDTLRDILKNQELPDGS
eukprot:5279157-Pyramimonas_sp.AAC.1